MAYNKLSDIALRKAEIKAKIQEQEEIIANYKTQLVEENQPKKKGFFNISSIVSYGSTALDGALFAWKLYRKFKK